MVWPLVNSIKLSFPQNLGFLPKYFLASLDQSKKNGFLGVYFWEIGITFIIVISNPLGSELFISLFSNSAPSAPSAVKSFRNNRKRY